MDLILPHINADFDSVASALAATKLYPNARVFFPGSQEPNVRDFLGLYPDIFPSIRSHALKKEPLNHLILVDVSSAERLGEFKDLLSEPGVRVIRYDHHGAVGAKIPAEQEVIRSFGANTTIMVQELRQRRIPVTALEATVYALGIYEETGNLTFTSTTPEDLEAAAWLLKNGADLTQVADFIVRRLNVRQQELLNDLLRSRETHTIHGVEVSFARAERDNFLENLALLTSRLRDLENLPVLFVLCRMGYRTYLVARSRMPEVDAGAVVRRMGGGGHPTAAAATLKEVDLTRLQQELIGILQEEIKPVKTAGDLMSSPVPAVTSQATIAEAREIMTCHGCSGLAVVDDGNLVGMITLHDMEKALRHGLAQSAVRHYMSTRLVTAQVREPASQVQRNMVIHAISHIPVLEEGRLVGMVTRSDLMRVLLEKKTAAPVVNEDFIELQAGRTSLKSLMRERLPEKVLGLLHTAGEVADRAGLNAYVVGGFVRDILLNKENWDIDVVVEGDGIDFAGRLAQALAGEVKAAHQRFGTALVVLPDLKMDVVTARTEFYARPAALPQVEASSLKADLYRRDFTINAMAIQINPENFGRLVDYFGGRQDLKAGLIRVLYAVSFIDDPTRIFRAVRFEQRYHFRIEKDTENYIRNALKLDLMRKLSFPRIFDELMLILAEDQPGPALERLAEFNVLSWIHPRLTDIRTATRYFDAIWEAFAFALLFLDSPIQRQWVYLMALLDSLTLQEISDMTLQYQFPHRITEALLIQKKQGEAAREQLAAAPGMPPSQMARLLRHLPLEVLLFEMAKAGSTPAARNIHDYLARWRQVRPLLTGKDLKKLHYPPGPFYQKMLEDLLAGRLDGAIVSRQDELKYLQEHYPRPEP